MSCFRVLLAQTKAKVKSPEILDCLSLGVTSLKSRKKPNQRRL